MLEGTERAEAAITGSERHFSRRLLVDWGNDGTFGHELSDLSRFVVRAEREQAITSTTPDEIQLVEGHAAAKLVVELAGHYRDRTLADQFAPYNRSSVFYSGTTGGRIGGVTVHYDLAVWDGREWVWFPQFRGVVREVEPDRDGTLRIECLDNVERMRTPVDVAPYAVWESELQKGYKRGMLVDSSSLIDLAARSAGFTMGPAHRWPPWGSNMTGDEFAVTLVVPFHGSVLPEIGQCDGDMSFHLTESWQSNQFAYRAEAYRDGPHGYLALNAVPPERVDFGYKKFWPFDPNNYFQTIAGTFVLGGWVYWPGVNVDGNCVLIEQRVRGNLLQLYIAASTGAVEARLRKPDGFHPWTNTPLRLGSVGWHYVEARFRIAAYDFRMRVRIDDDVSADSIWTDNRADEQSDDLTGLTTIRNQYAVSDVFTWKSSFLTDLHHFHYDRTPADTARVSWGRNRLTHTLRETGREAWDLATEVAAAEYGTVFFDEHGRFIFWTYRDVIDRQAQSLRTFTLDDLTALSLRNTIDSIRNVWTVTTTTAASKDGIAYDLGRDGLPLSGSPSGEMYPAVFIVPSGSAGQVFRVPVNDHTMSFNPFRIPYLADGHHWETESPIFGCKSYTGGIGYRPQGPDSRQRLENRHMARLHLWNGYQEPVGFVAPNGQVRFRLGGRIVVEDDPSTWTVRDPASVDVYGERVLTLDNNRWLQDRWQTEAMLREVVNRMGRPIPVSEKITVPADPRLQIGDTVTLTDPSGFGERIKVQILGVRRTDSTDGLTDVLTVEAVEPPGPGQWDHPVIGQWDTSMIWG